jgi:dsRNA-specific ribonuclease
MMNKIQAIIKASVLNSKPKYQAMSETELESETAALAKMTVREMEVLQGMGVDQHEAQTEALKTILKHQA